MTVHVVDVSELVVLVHLQIVRQHPPGGTLLENNRSISIGKAPAFFIPFTNNPKSNGNCLTIRVWEVFVGWQTDGHDRSRVKFGALEHTQSSVKVCYRVIEA